jgi:hypothetical protein
MTGIWCILSYEVLRGDLWHGPARVGYIGMISVFFLYVMFGTKVHLKKWPQIQIPNVCLASILLPCFYTFSLGTFTFKGAIISTFNSFLFLFIFFKILYLGTSHLNEIHLELGVIYHLHVNIGIHHSFMILSNIETIFLLFTNLNLLLLDNKFHDWIN